MATCSRFFYHHSFTHINDQNKWQSLRKEETEPTKGSLTAISTTDVFTEGCLLSAEQSHTWETPKSFRETSRKPTCKFVTAMSQTSGPTAIFISLGKKKRGGGEKKEEKTRRKESSKYTYQSGWFKKKKGGGTELELQYQKKTADNIVMCHHEKISPYWSGLWAKGCTIDRKTEYVAGAIFHTFGLLTPSRREGVFLGCI